VFMFLTVRFRAFGPSTPIHGNISPEREVIEWVYFERFTPLFKEPGDVIGDIWNNLERLYKPKEVVQDYVDMHMFFEEIIDCIEPKVADTVRGVLETSYPGFDVGRKKVGQLFPETIVTGPLPGVLYDDELS
jgi:hypothetical protein